MDFWQIPIDSNCGQNDGPEELQTFDANWCAPTIDLSADSKKLKKKKVECINENDISETFKNIGYIKMKQISNQIELNPFAKCP